MALLLSVCVMKVVNAQSLLPADARKRANISEKIDLTPAQEHLIDSLFNAYGLQLADLEARMKAAERNPDLGEDEVVVRMNVIAQERTDLRDSRELELLMVFTPEQRAHYQTTVAPKKPAVLHFGVHNRMDCNVCAQ